MWMILTLFSLWHYVSFWYYWWEKTCKDYTGFLTLLIFTKSIR